MISDRSAIKSMEPITEKRWLFRNPDAALVNALTAAGYTSLQAKLLVQRGVSDSAAATRFLSGSLADLPDPFLLLGMTAAVARLLTAVAERQLISIYGDYDVDGVTATTLLVRFFRALNVPVAYHIPQRLADGYGLSPEGITAVAATGTRVVISVDCGITAIAEAALCRDLGLDLIVTDHHLPGSELPDALAIINPQQPGCSFPAKGLAGVGLAFYLAIALRSRLRETGYFSAVPEPNLREYLDLVALGTIADMVPLQGVNRLLVHFGLHELSRSTQPGLVALKQVSGITGEVNCGMVGFRLGPRINAAGRLENAASGVELLLTDSLELAAQLAQLLDDSNRARQDLEQEILADALRKVQSLPVDSGRHAIVLASTDWHPGVIGIVASRLVELYHRPTILIALQEGHGKGSGRSIPALHLKDALAACAEHLLKFGGHRQAAGLAVGEENLAAFIERFSEVTAGLLEDDDLIPELRIDVELTPDALTLGRVEELQRLAPFGIGNPEPLFLVRQAAVAAVRPLNGGHLRLTLHWSGQSLVALCFSPGTRSIASGDQLDLVGALQVNTWQGRSTIQLRVKDFRPAGQEIA